MPTRPSCIITLLCLFPSSSVESFSFEASHVFSNLKKVVHFVSFEHLVRDIDFWSEQCGVYLSHSSVIVQVHLP